MKFSKNWFSKLGQMPDAVKASFVSAFVNALRLLWEIFKYTQPNDIHTLTTDNP